VSPLLFEETQNLRRNLSQSKTLFDEEGALSAQGTGLTADGDLETPLIDNKDCYVFFDGKPLRNRTNLIIKNHKLEKNHLVSCSKC
jgi:hypothetical protein